MDLQELKQQYVREEIGINENFGRIFSFIDFGNVNNWFNEDRQDWDNHLLADLEKITIDLEKLKKFADSFSVRTRNYYGFNSNNEKSLSFTYAMRKIFGNRDFVTKNLQKIKHYLGFDEKEGSERVFQDNNGKNYIEIRKCNFDVEISVDAIKMMDHYDAFCIFSSDADFVYLNNFLRKKGRKIILIKAGYITEKLRKSADLIINAQKIKRHIACIKTKT